ncbi:unnamed protein product, partial [Trypanosoma congolense IL3000]
MHSKDLTQPRAKPATSSAAAETEAEIAEVEDNLRRLGLLGDISTADRRSTNMRDPESYMAAIKKSKEEAARALCERECRQHAVEKQKQENRVVVSASDRERELQSVLEEARLLLGKEKDSAYDISAGRCRKFDLCSIRTQELAALAGVHHRKISCAGGASVANDDASLSDLASTGLVERRRALKAAAAKDYCQLIVKGISELAIRVADNMYITTAYSEIPMRRFPQSLSVTKWLTWVDELVFPKVKNKPLSDLLAGTTLSELRSTNYAALKELKEEGPDLSEMHDPRSRRVSCDERSVETGGSCNDHLAVAADAITTVTELQCKYRSKLITNGVQEGVLLVKYEEERELLDQLDKIRAMHEAEMLEEALPGWEHKLPPVGCFIFGDELSGLKQLSDGLASDVPLEGTTTVRQRSTVTQTLEMARTVSEWESVGDDSLCHRVITPTQLIKGQHIAGQGGVGLAVTGGARSFRGGLGLSPFGRTRESKQIEDFVDSKQHFEVICEALVKELIAVYVHNVMVLLRPNADSNAVVADGPVSMRILFLVGFPDTEVFLRSLHQRLHAALETTEADINRLLKGDDDEMGSAACALGKYTTRVGTANSASRKKGNRVSLSQCSKKGGTSRSLTSDCEENPPVRSRVYPPLCLVGTFLQYDISSRYQRMRDVRTRSAQNSAEIPLFIPNAMGTRSVSNVSSALGHSDEDSGGSQAEWTVQRLRLELIQQDHQMRQSWKTWCNNVSKCTLFHPAEVERSHHHDKGKRRTRQSMTSSRSNDQGTINPSPAPPSQGHTVPKVLFFQRREIAPDNVEHSDVLLYLVLSLKCSLRLISNCLADGSLVAGQLAAPLKLSDYRHPASTLAQLSEHNDRFHVRWNDVTPSIFRKVRNSSMFSVASQPQSGQLSSSACSGENSTAWEDAMLLEAEMYRVFHLNASDLLCFLTREVFPPSLWAAKFPPEASTNMTITSTDEFSSRTLHFMALDENYQMSCDALRSLMSDGLTELSATGALLLSRVIDTTLMEVGEGLKRFAAWCFSHMTSLPYLKQVADGDSPSPGSATSPSTVAFSICDTPVLDQKLNFLSCVPRLDFNELLGEVHRLDGQPESLEKFQRFVWSYSSRVHEFALAWLHECTETIACRLGVTVPPSMKINAPYVVHALLAKLFAAAPLATNDSHPVAAGEGDGVLLSDGVPNPLEAAYKNVLHSMKSPSISVSIGRLMASIGSLKRCCMISAVCAARWVDAMYAKALKVPPAEKLPAECRPANIAAIFTPPACPQEDLASHSLMAVQMLTPLAPNFTFDPQRNCNCWEETGMEVILQSFSTHQKSIVSGEEFVHSILQAQLKCIWKLLPDRLHELTARLGVPFSLPTRVNRSNLAVEGDTLDSLLRWIRLRYCKSSAETPLLTEDDCWHIFRSASRSQKQAPPCIENTTKPHQQRLPSVVLLEGAAGRPLKRITLHLQEFFAGLIFRRSCHSDILAIVLYS